MRLQVFDHPAWLAFVLVVLLTAATWVASQAPAAPKSGGWIVTLSRAKVGFGVTADTVPEIPADSAAQPVRAAAGRYALLIRFDPTCSRFFTTQDRVIVMLQVLCDRPKMRMADYGIAFMAVDREGAVVAGPVFEVPEWIGQIVPTYRKSSDPAHARRSQTRRFKVP